MFQFNCPGCKQPIYSRNPESQGGYRCLSCGFAAPTISAVEAAVEEAALAEKPAVPEEWELIDQLGVGGMGVVYRARHRLTGELVALKCVLGPHADDPAFAQRFAREVNLLHKMRHDRLVALRHSGIVQGRPWLAMELVAGGSLRDRVDRGPIAIGDAVDFAVGICEGLEYMHGCGIVHRDLKPDNVLLQDGKQVKVTDFGLAAIQVPTQSTPRLTQVGVPMGTVDYMAPEQMRDASSAGPRADLFALGVILFEMLVGGRPHGAEHVSVEVAGVPRELDELIYALLQREQARRPASATEVLLALRSLQQELVGSGTGLITAEASSPAEPARRPKREGVPWTKVAISKPPGASASPGTPVEETPAEETPPPGAVTRPTAPETPDDPESAADGAARPGPPDPSGDGAPAADPVVPESGYGSDARRPAALAWRPGPDRESGGRGSPPVKAALGLGALGLAALVWIGVSQFGGPPGATATDPTSPAPVVAQTPRSDAGTVIVQSTPAGARVLTENGKDTGQLTPASFSGVEAEVYRFRVVMEGYSEAQASGTFKAGRSLTHPVQLERR